MMQIDYQNDQWEMILTSYKSGYSENRRRGREVVRVITELPAHLVKEVDEWGVAAGMKSRREATETLLMKGLECAQK